MGDNSKIPVNELNIYCYKDQIYDIINTLELNNETEKNILRSRFLAEVISYENRRNNTKKYYDVFRFLVTTGSILLPAILSMGQMDPAKLPKNFENISYWTSWTISLMVTACNGFLQLFSLDKNYFEYAITTEQMKTEGWQFFQLSGKYDDFEDHKEAYKPFCKSIENIKRKQVEKEFPGKADVNKGKKEGKKSFNFEQELLKNLPQQYNNKLDESIESKNKIMDEKMDEKMDKLLDLFNRGQTTVQSTVQSGQQLASTIGNVKELLTSVEVEPKITIHENNPIKPKSKSTD